MNKEVTIIAVKLGEEAYCYKCTFNQDNIPCSIEGRMMGLPDCAGGYIYKIKDDGNESISDT